MSSSELIDRDLERGVKISEFNSDYKSYWEDYGVKENDIIKKINGEEINSIADIDKIVKSRKYYDPISIEILTKDNKLERFNLDKFFYANRYNFSCTRTSFRTF